MRRGMSNNNPFTTAAVAISAAKRVIRGRAAPQSSLLLTAHARSAGIRTRKPRKSGAHKTPRSMARKSLKKTIRTIVRQEGTVHSKPPPSGGVQVWRPIMYGISTDSNKFAAVTNAMVFTNDTMYGLNVWKMISAEALYPTLAEYQVGLGRNKAIIIGVRLRIQYKSVGITGTTELKLKLVKTSEAFEGIANADGINYSKPSSFGTNDCGRMTFAQMYQNDISEGNSVSATDGAINPTGWSNKPHMSSKIRKGVKIVKEIMLIKPDHRNVQHFDVEDEYDMFIPCKVTVEDFGKLEATTNRPMEFNKDDNLNLVFFTVNPAVTDASSVRVRVLVKISALLSRPE
ncbi:hypothetical protein T492DRAFT_848493 [Pavlovales sp. CCMP2436]|nr:hypothetical protein T492DRAFT_848493 [Pavlovales sp. CCMP2436]